MSDVYVEEINGTMILRGNTYPYKDTLKRLGFRWKGNQKCWQHPSSSHMLRAQVARIIGHAPTVTTAIEVEVEPSNINFHSRDSRSRSHHEGERPRNNMPGRLDFDGPERSLGHNQGGVVVHFLDEDDDPASRPPGRIVPDRDRQEMDRRPIKNRGQPNLHYSSRRESEMRQFQSPQNRHRPQYQNDQRLHQNYGGHYGNQQADRNYYAHGHGPYGGGASEVYVDQTPSVHLEVYCPSEDEDEEDYVY